MNRQSTPGKSLYTIFPKSDTDTSRTAAFIKQIVTTDGLLPPTDIGEGLISWIVEASPEEVSQLRGNTDIDRIIQFQPLPSSLSIPNIRSLLDTSTMERLDERQEPVVEYMVFAKGGTDQAETNQTERVLHDLVGGENVNPAFMYKTQPRYWLCNST
jgi:hypothetical protein